MTDKKPLKINIQSEIGDLEAVLLHTPGAEVENMTPKMAQRALYSDILNLSIAQEEYKQLREPFTATFSTSRLHRKNTSSSAVCCPGSRKSTAYTTCL